MQYRHRMYRERARSILQYVIYCKIFFVTVLGLKMNVQPIKKYIVWLIEKECYWMEVSNIQQTLELPSSYSVYLNALLTMLYQCDDFLQMKAFY
jgi:hypothetical protein